MAKGGRQVHEGSNVKDYRTNILNALLGDGPHTMKREGWQCRWDLDMSRMMRKLLYFKNDVRSSWRAGAGKRQDLGPNSILSKKIGATDRRGIAVLVRLGCWNGKKSRS